VKRNTKQEQNDDINKKKSWRGEGEGGERGRREREGGREGGEREGGRGREREKEKLHETDLQKIRRP
jgi:hypothetical protein